MYEKIVEVPEEEAEQDDDFQPNAKVQLDAIEGQVVQPKMIDSDVEEEASVEDGRVDKKASFEMT